MIWLIIWTVLIIINVCVHNIVVLKPMKRDKGKITYGHLLSFFICGIIVAPLLTGVILIAGAINLYNKLADMNIMDKTIYRFK